MTFTIYKQLPIRNKKLIEIAPEIIKEYEQFQKKPAKAKRIFVFRDRAGHFVKKDYAGKKTRYSIPIFREIKTGKYEKKAIGTPEDFIKIYKNEKLFYDVPDKNLKRDFSRLINYEKRFSEFKKSKKLINKNYPVSNEVFPENYKTLMKVKFKNEDGEYENKVLTIWHNNILSKRKLKEKLKEIIEEDEYNNYENLTIVSMSAIMGLRSRKMKNLKSPSRTKSLRR